MGVFESKEYLRRLRSLDREIDALIERRQRYEAQAARCTAAYSDMPRSGRQGSRTEYFACKLVDLAREIDRRIDEHVDLAREIDGMIAALPDSRHQDILRYRYLDGWGWKKIADKLGLPESTVRGRLHGNALRGLHKI